MPKLAKRLTLVACGLAGGLAVAEVALAVLALPDDSEVFAIMGPDAASFERDPLLLWRLRADATLYHANRVGTRGWWPAEDGPADRLRIACIGDSSTFGVGGRCEDACGGVLEQLLHERHDRLGAEVLLAGLPGHSTFQNLQLYRSRVAPLSPDVVVLYPCGWNDSRPGLGGSDATFQRAERAFADSAWSALRTVRTAREAMLRRSAGAAEERAAAGEAVAPRVAVDDFVGCVEAMIGEARAAGAEVVVIVPPLPRATVAAHPELADYRAALRRLVERAEVTATIDGDAEFAAHDAALSPAARALAGGESPCFLDHVHPSALGHRVLAAALARALDGVARAHAATEPPAVQIDAVAVDLERGALVADGRGFLSLTPADRLWLGNHWLRARQVPQDSRLVVPLPRHLPGGSYRLAVLTARGAVRSEPVALVQPALAVTLDARTGQVAARIDGCPPSHVRLWFSPQRAEHPRRTPYGPFALLGGEPADAADLPLRWTELALPALEASTDGGGAWTLQFPIGAKPTTDAVWAQALAVDPDWPFEGFLTAAVRVRVDGG